LETPYPLPLCHVPLVRFFRDQVIGRLLNSFTVEMTSCWKCLRQFQSTFI